MKAATFLPPPTSLASGGALNNYKVYLSILCLIIVTLWNTHSVTAAPAQLDSIDPTFPLDLQPPIFEATVSESPPSSSQPKGDNDVTTVDSYGNPIESLQPIDTPDGRKVVSAEGLQFEIPNYASGITELKKPADDLLPPFIDPIVVALPNESPESFSTNAGPTLTDETTSVDVESVPLVEVTEETQSSKASLVKVLPDYILELNDPDIGGPVDYEPSADKRGLNVIAWDLLPPLNVEDFADKSISHINKVSVTTGHNSNAQASRESSHTTQRPQLGFTNPTEDITTTTTPNYTQSRGGVFYTRTTATSRYPTTTTTTTTTTTPRTTTTARATTTTTRRTTTPRTATTTTTTTAPDTSEFFKLEGGNSYTLPTWLLEIDDPELDVAVAYEVPEDIHEYNHTIERDILPPLEPYTDLNILHLTPPSNYDETSTTPKTNVRRNPITSRTSTTTTAATTTTTNTSRHPTLPTTQPHWIRVKPTLPKPTIATFNNQFTSLSPSISSTFFAQNITSTTVKPKSTRNFFNRQFSSNTPQTDKIGSSGEEVTTKSNNPLFSTFDNGKYKPQSTRRRTPTSTTTTTTTTTVAPEINEKNPFESTIPPWLKDFDDPDVGPGVPFVYNPDEDENDVDEDIVTPTKAADFNKTNNSSTSPFLNSQTPQGFTNKFASSLISSSSIPSIAIIPLPSTQKNQADNTLTRPHAVFVPPQHKSAEGIVIADNSFNKHFAAPFDSVTDTNSVTATAGSDPKKIPLSADRESFPPFNNVITGSSTIPSKTTFTKSEDGKVITSNIFLNGDAGSVSTKPIGSSQVINSQEKNSLTTQSSTGSAFTTSAETSSFVTSSGSSSSSASTFGFTTTSNDLRYTGHFGGPPGILAPQGSSITASSTAATKSHNKPALSTFGVTSSTGLATNNNGKFTGSFGGPPGILKPYDNIKNR